MTPPNDGLQCPIFRQNIKFNQIEHFDWLKQIDASAFKIDVPDEQQLAIIIDVDAAAKAAFLAR
jgi:hypothetical protein